MTKKKHMLKPIDAPVYGYWRALHLSFYSKRLYIDVGKRWSSYGWRYLMLLVLLWSIPISIKIAVNFNDVFNQQLIEPLSMIPTVYIQNGQASLDKPMPYLVKNKNGQVVLIVDTTGTINRFSPQYPNLLILINKDRIAFNMPKPQLLATNTDHDKFDQPLVQIFDKNENLVLNGKEIVTMNMFSTWKYFAQLIIYPIFASMFFPFFMFMFTVLGLLGKVIARTFFSFPITLKQSCRLVMVAATPMMLVFLFSLLFSVFFMGLGFIGISVLAFYFCFGVYALKSESKRMVRV